MNTKRSKALNSSAKPENVVVIPPEKRAAVSVTTAAELLELAVVTVRKHIYAGHINFVRIGAHPRITPREIKRIVRQGLPPLPSPKKEAA